jgi:hypothetical protein
MKHTIYIDTTPYEVKQVSKAVEVVKTPEWM